MTKIIKFNNIIFFDNISINLFTSLNILFYYMFIRHELKDLILTPHPLVIVYRQILNALNFYTLYILNIVTLISNCLVVLNVTNYSDTNWFFIVEKNLYFSRKYFF